MCVGACKQCGKMFTQPGSFEMHKCVVDYSKMSMGQLLRMLYNTGGCSKHSFIKDMATHYEEGDVILLKADVKEGWVEEKATLVEINYAKNYAVVHLHSAMPEDDGYREITVDQIKCWWEYREVV